MRTLIAYWVRWRLFQLLCLPEYTYHWYRSAFKVKLCELQIKSQTRLIEDKYERIFEMVDLDFNGYLCLKDFKDQEIEFAVNNINKRYFPSLFK